ncbi:hypothetical protein KM043_010707 [Ampulex compressa]|nr:hypothetical protein KM043_010707 [Ampulex compressa]
MPGLEFRRPRVLRLPIVRLALDANSRIRVNGSKENWPTSITPPQALVTVARRWQKNGPHRRSAHVPRIR